MPDPARDLPASRDSPCSRTGRPLPGDQKYFADPGRSSLTGYSGLNSLYDSRTRKASRHRPVALGWRLGGVVHPRGALGVRAVSQPALARCPAGRAGRAIPGPLSRLAGALHRVFSQRPRRSRGRVADVRGAERGPCLEAVAKPRRTALQPPPMVRGLPPAACNVCGGRGPALAEPRNRRNRKAHGLRVAERRCPCDSLSAARPVVRRRDCQLLLPRLFHGGLRHAPQRGRSSRRLQPCRGHALCTRRAGRGFGRLRPGRAHRRREARAYGGGGAGAGSHDVGRQPGRPARHLLGQHRHAHRILARHRLERLTHDSARGRQRADRLHDQRIPSFLLHSGRPAPARDGPAIHPAGRLAGGAVDPRRR